MKQHQQRAEIKSKLSGLRERSKQMLSKHNWQKYFIENYQQHQHEMTELNSSSGCSSMATMSKDLFKLNYKKVLSAIDIDFSTSSALQSITTSTTTTPSVELSKIGFDASTLIASQTSMFYIF